MKKIVINVFLILMLVHAYAQTPNANEMFKQKKTQRKYSLQQIAALKVYLEYLKKGYNIVDKGLTAIGDIKNGTFNLDKDYFNSLKQVNPVIKKSPKVNDILVYQQTILSHLRTLVNDSRKDNYLNQEELSYIEKVYHNMIQECNASIDELTMITTAGEAEMKDDERLLRLDKVHEEMQDKYAFTEEFIQSVRLISRQRSKELQQIQKSQQLQGDQI